MTLTQYWNALEKTGWLKSVPAREHNKLKARIAEALEAGEPWKALVSGGYDVECIENEGDYVELLNAYSEASYGKFKPERASDSIDWDECKATIAFTLKDKRYRRTFEHDGDVVSEDFDAVINAILKKAHVPERFFQLPSEDQVAALTFVRPGAIRRAVKDGLVPEDALGVEIEDDDEAESSASWLDWKPVVHPSGSFRGRLKKSASSNELLWACYMLCGQPETRIAYEDATPVQQVAWLVFEFQNLIQPPFGQPDSYIHYFNGVDPSHVSAAIEALRVMKADDYARNLEEAWRRHRAAPAGADYSDLDEAYRRTGEQLFEKIEPYLAAQRDQFVVSEG